MPHLPPRATRALHLSALAAAASLGPMGCVGPLDERPEDVGRRLPAQRLREASRLPLEAFPARAAPSEESLIAASPRLTGADAVPLSIERVRVETLRNNLDLRAALVDPAIGAAELSEERARFEAVFRPSLRYSNRNDPVFDVTAANARDDLIVGADVDVPLRTGGRATVGLTGTRSQTDNPFFQFDTAFSSDVTFSLSQPLLRNAGRTVTVAPITIAGYRAQAAEARTRLRVTSELAAADRAYWRLYAARRELDVRQRQFELAQEQRAQAERRVQAGDLPEVEALRAQSGLAAQLEAIISAENNVLVQQRELKRLMLAPDLDPGGPQELTPQTEPAPLDYELDPGPLVELALANRAELLEAELSLLAEAVNIDVARNQTLPLFDIEGSYQLGGIGEDWGRAGRQIAESEFRSYQVGVRGEVPLGNEAAQARLRRALLTRLQRLISRDARRQTVRQEVLDAIDRQRAAWQRILAARQSAILAGRTLDAERRQFDVGLRTSTDVLDAAARLADAQSSEVRALTDYQIALVDLAVATGTVLGAGDVRWSPLDEPAEGDRSVPDAAGNPRLTRPEIIDADSLRRPATPAR